MVTQRLANARRQLAAGSERQLKHWVYRLGGERWYGRAGRVKYRLLRHSKARNELGYWQLRKREEGTLRNDHYERFYTSHFGLDREDYRGKRILDIGCGPRGSLEWADMAARRVGVDPLADEYRALGAAHHRMEYLAAPAEAIPCEDGAFDIVCAFNSLDHVDDLDAAIREIKRLVTPGGVFLLLADVNHQPTVGEPSPFSWDIVHRFEPEFDIELARRYRAANGGMYQSIDAGQPYTDDSGARRGVVSAMFRRR